MVKVVIFIIKRYKTKFIIAILIVAVILSSVCVTNFQNKSFTPRLTAPLKSNRYYYTSNVYYNSGYGMPNCTAYAWGRAYEILGSKPDLSLKDAKNWYEYNIKNKVYSFGKKPKVGAIACFENSQGGHVAVVEKIEDGIITFSNSAYGGTNFYLSYANVNDKKVGQEKWNFQGYIYILESSPEPQSLNSLREVNVKGGLNFRKEAGLSGEVISIIPKNSQLFISQIYNIDGYSWGRTWYQGQYGYCVIDYTKGI